MIFSKSYYDTIQLMEQFLLAFNYSLEAMTWVTWLVLFILSFQTVRSFAAAYQENESYEQMKTNPNKKGIANFYTAIITSLLMPLVFFLPYLLA